MADFITPIVDILTRLCGCCVNWADSIRQLGDSLNSLRNASSQLNSRYLDLKTKVETAQQDPNPELMILNEVKDWMGKVEVLQNEVRGIFPQGGQQIKARCFGGRCPRNCRASYKLHKMVTDKLSDVNDLISKGHFDAVAEKYARDLFDELPVDKAVGVESTFKELCSCFQNNQVGIIGLYGMGGVGKTTLLKKFNNDFLSTIPHYVVIWVVASKDADAGKIQDAIRKKLRVKDDIWNNKTMDERALLLYNILKKKKFALLLDDVWERIDLLKLGVPSPNNCECKIIFTTRLKEICGLMDAQRRIGVHCLSLDKAFELFREKVGETTLDNPHISDLAKQVVDECQGLPLALCTVGRAMVNKVTPIEWKRTIEILRSHPSKVRGIVEDVYHLLEFSYDRLPNDTYKSCFLYCTLFPEDYNIEKQELIFLWIAEGFLAEFDDIHEAFKQGEDIILGLNYACLLENGQKESTVKMHDVIRDMALWVACDHGEKTRFIVKDGSGTSGLEAYNHAKWKEVERLSLWGRGHMILSLSQKPHCPNLFTLIIRDTLVHDFPTEIFVLPSTIRVLDSSSNQKITNLPSAVEVYVNLEHMNLSNTGITKLPEEFRNLKKLKYLLLNGIKRLEFPRDVISNLSSLQAFSMLKGEYPVYDENVLLNELESLDHLQDVRISIFTASSLEKILISSKLQRCMCQLEVTYRWNTSLMHDLCSSLGKMEHLETLQVFDLSVHILEDAISEDSNAMNIPRSSLLRHENIIVLRRLTIVRCQIFDLNWLIYAPNLEDLELVDCDSLVEVISEDFGTADAEIVKSNIFRSLAHLHLRFLSNLRSICKMPLQCPSLKEIEVVRCHSLKKLPFNSQSALKNLQCIRGNRGWLDGLQWEDEVTKHLLISKFEPM